MRVMCTAGEWRVDWIGSQFSQQVPPARKRPTRIDARTDGRADGRTFFFLLFVSTIRSVTRDGRALLYRSLLSLTCSNVAKIQTRQI
jgi:hypothetical protein